VAQRSALSPVPCLPSSVLRSPRTWPSFIPPSPALLRFRIPGESGSPFVQRPRGKKANTRGWGRPRGRAWASRSLQRPLRPCRGPARPPGALPPFRVPAPPPARRAPAPSARPARSAAPAIRKGGRALQRFGAPARGHRQTVSLSSFSSRSLPPPPSFPFSLSRGSIFGGAGDGNPSLPHTKNALSH
jgi:hypothetical protein